MTDYMAQLVPGPPTSRQDIVSALLNDYGSSFEDGHSSPYKLSPAPSFKQLPPPPPESARERNFGNDNSSPAVQKMNTPFRLRVNAPPSPESPNVSSVSEGSPSRIVHKRLKRRSVPRSLSLTISNGSTAELPPAPTISSQSESQDPFRTPIDDKALPPPPPEKSTRRQPSAMGNHSSAVRSPRKDSIHSQDGKEDMEPVRRKPLPPKFTSLADLGNGRRGGKGGPSPLPRSARQPSFETDVEQERGRSAVRPDAVETPSREDAPRKLKEQLTPLAVPRIVNPLPPTPRDELAPAPPPSSKKPFGGMGLPSNPKHRKGKSDTGFDALNSATSPRPHMQLPAPPTPGPTPTPRRIENMGNEEIVERPARLSPGVSNSQRRPFSFETGSTSPQLEDASAARKPSSGLSRITTPTRATNTQPSSAKILAEDSFVASTPPPAVASPQPTTSLQQQQQQLEPAFTNLPSQQHLESHPDTQDMSSSPENMSASASSTDAETDAPATPPFIPLTATPLPAPGPPITQKHHTCYSHHATFVWSRNDFQPMSCMICNKQDSERRWACVWCYLRICVDCSVELQKTPGRNLQSVLERRAEREKEEDAGSVYEEDGEPMVVGGAVQVNGVNGVVNGEAGVNGKRHDSGNANPSLVVWDADDGDVGFN